VTRPLRSPELPDAARPRWPPWYGPVALVASIGAVVGVLTPLLPVVLLGLVSEPLAGVSLLVLLLVQDSMLVGTAVLLAWLARRPRPRPWHFGLRATRLWPTLGWTLLAFALMLGFELGWIELLGVDEGNLDIDRLGGVAGTALALAVIVVAPVAEEIFFRGFFYRALRTRLRVPWAALIDGLVFGSLHFQGVSRDALLVLPVIAVFGIGQCLLYERTGSIFAVIATHAAFNTVATLSVAPIPALVVGALTLLACLVAARGFGQRPSPVPA
jgi:uncharacterized protein